MDQTDELCRKVGSDADVPVEATPRVFAATYGFGRPASDAVLPASTIAWACHEDGFLRRREGVDTGSVARALLERSEHAGLGSLYLAASLLRPVSAQSAPLIPSLVSSAVRSGAYHLQLEVMQLVQEAAHHLDDSGHSQIADALRQVPGDNLFLNSAYVEAMSALGEVTPARTLEDIVEEIHDVLSRPEDELALRQASGIVSSQFEEEDIVGPYYEAVEELTNKERDQLLTMALRAGRHDDITTSWIVEELEDLSDPKTRDVIVTFVCAANPKEWHSSQFGVANVLCALKLVADSGLPLPMRPAEADPAWSAFLAVVFAAFCDAAARPSSESDTREAWDELLGNHRDARADLLANLHSSATGVGFDHSFEVESRLLQVRAAEIREVLVWSIEHPDQLRSVIRWSAPGAATKHAMQILGQIGEQEAADVMRRFANDPELGETARSAVSEIEARLVRQ